MKFLALLIHLLFAAHLMAQEATVEIDKASKTSLFAESYNLYQQGKYAATVEELNEVIKRNPTNQNKSFLGLVAYWKGLCFSRLQDFQSAIPEFSQALSMDYVPKDLNYEYGQALFAAEKLSEARLQFRESLKKKFKRAVSLYYIAFISKEMDEKKKAVTFYKAIKKLDAAEAAEVRQAAEMQIGDIYLEQVEKHSDAFRAVEDYVIPQYKVALEVDPESNLASDIQEKIKTLQRKYDLLLFKLRNGRATLIPPYFLRLAGEYGIDSNVTFSPTEQEIAESKRKSPYAKTDMIGRYTFYLRDFLSISPEFRFNYTRYMNREPEIYRNDNYLLAPAIRTSYEHHLWKRPASVLFDYDYSEIKRDIDSEQQLKFASRSHTLMIGERFNYFKWGESIVRLRRKIFDSYTADTDSTTTSLVMEQIRSFSINTLLFYGSYDMMRVKNDYYDTNAFTFRTDFIFARFRDWFTPSFGVGVGMIKPLNNPVRGTEYLINPNMRLSKTFKKNWRGNLKFDYQDYKSDDANNYAFKKYTYSFELEYLF
jgi:tetratricopeptide (TPR) repeat protein